MLENNLKSLIKDHKNIQMAINELAVQLAKNNQTTHNMVCNDSENREMRERYEQQYVALDEFLTLAKQKKSWWKYVTGGVIGLLTGSGVTVAILKYTAWLVIL